MHRGASRRVRVKRISAAWHCKFGRNCYRGTGIRPLTTGTRVALTSPENPMLTKHKLALLIAAPLVTGATTYALAQGDAPTRKDVIQKFDKNGDGRLDDAERAERKAAFEVKRAERHQQRLATYDTNQDGTLDGAERKAMRDDKLAQRFRAMDKNGDGTLTLDEFKAGAGARGGFRRHGRHGRHGHGRTPGAGGKH